MADSAKQVHVNHQKHVILHQAHKQFHLVLCHPLVALLPKAVCKLFQIRYQQRQHLMDGLKYCKGVFTSNNV